MIYEKYQDKDKFILNNALSDIKWNQIIDMIKETNPLILG